MARKSLCKRFQKKGLSAIVTTLILVALSMGAIVLVWAVVNKMILSQTQHTEACFGNYEKVTLNELYTCYEETPTTPIKYEVHFSLMIGDIDVEKVMIGISSASAVKSYTITNTLETVDDLNFYPTAREDGKVKLPVKNAGLTYITTAMDSKPDLIQIQPVINSETCEMSDSVSEIENCLLIS